MEIVFYYDKNCPYSKNARPYAQAIAKEYKLEYIEYANGDEDVPELFKSNEYPQFHIVENGEIKKTIKGFTTTELQSTVYKKVINDLLGLAASLILTIIAVWYEGAIAKDAQYQAAIQEMQVKIAESEKKAAEANAKIEYIFIDRVQRIKDVQVVVKEKLKTVAVNIDDQCRITHDVVDIHNTSARNKR